MNPAMAADPGAAPSDLVVTARPVRSARIATGASVLIVVVFAIAAAAAPHAGGGAHLGVRDQIGIIVVGLVLAGTALLPTRPRLYADATGVRMRAYLGGYRSVPWDLVTAVEFPDRLRFARLVLPGEETLALYAVQRFDRERSVVTMQGLRRLLHASRGGAPGDAPCGDAGT